MSGIAPPTQNRLLAALPEAELDALERSLEYIRLPLGRSLHEPGEPLRHVFFPTSGIVSLLDVRESGASAELMVVGCEGLIGLPALLGGETATNRAVVQAEGRAYRLGTLGARTAFAASRRFQALVLRCAHSLILELSQTAFCNLHHVVEQQFCRWLLLCHDRLQQDEIQMTHELIASMLGVRRQGVTEAARKLQQRKAISYSRGRIKVLDRAALETAACDCYRVLKRQTSALFGDPPSENAKGLADR
jgi:CRP-like cAMP-binding protein